MTKFFELLSRADPETVVLMGQWTVEQLKKSPREVNDYLKSLFRRELNNALDVPGIPK